MIVVHSPRHALHAPAGEQVDQDRDQDERAVDVDPDHREKRHPGEGGPGFRAGHEIQGAVSLLDLAPTLAHLLGLTPAPEWEGKCIHEALA